MNFKGKSMHAVTSSSIKNIPTDIKTNLKLQDERTTKVKKALYTFIQDNNVEIVNEDIIHFEGKSISIDTFSERLKWVLESKHKNFPIVPIEEYVRLLREINADGQRTMELIHTNMNSKYMTEAEILALVDNPKLEFSKSLEQAKEFLSHVLFRIPDANGAIKVIAKRYYQVTNLEGEEETLEKEIIIPGFKNLRDYEETLKYIPIKTTIHEKPETYWDVFLRSKAVVQANMTYNPYKEIYWRDEFMHHYVNTYKEPLWKEEPDYYYLKQQHQVDPMNFNKLSPLLRSFLMHLIPDATARREVLKWCAFSTEEKLQTYLTLIGAQGIGKTLLVESLLGYYHGEENIHFPKKIDIRFNAKNAISTLLYFDEKSMVNLDDYNEMKSYINTKLAFEEKGKPVFMAENFANIVWSCNNKDSMSGMSREDRRFKIIPLTDVKLMGANIYNIEGEPVGQFTSEMLKELATSLEIKKEFVRLMLSLKDHVVETKESKNDINSINENAARDEIFRESRSLEFTDIIDVLKNVFVDYNPVTDKFGSKPMTQDEKETLGTAYEDYIPLSKLYLSRSEDYTYRVPFAVIRKVIASKAGKNSKGMSFRTFNRHLDNMPPKFLKSISIAGVMRDVEIRLHGHDKDSHEYFIENHLPILEYKLNPKDNPLGKSSNKKDIPIVVVVEEKLVTVEEFVEPEKIELDNSDLCEFKAKITKVVYNPFI